MTSDVRVMIKLVAERMAPQLQGWMTRVAKKHPERALDIYLRMIEYHIPKLVRSELTGPNGSSLNPPVVHVHFPGLQDKRQEMAIEIVHPKTLEHKR